MADLESYLIEASGKPWAWGIADCTMFAADWVRLATGRDPGERSRGRYTSEIQARRWIRRAGGFVALVRSEMDRLGFQETSNPVTGDIGLIEVPIRMADTMPVVGAVMGIRSGKWWVARGLDTVRGGHFPCVIAWAVGR